MTTQTHPVSDPEGYTLFTTVGLGFEETVAQVRGARASASSAE